MTISLKLKRILIFVQTAFEWTRSLQSRVVISSHEFVVLSLFLKFKVCTYNVQVYRWMIASYNCDRFSFFFCCHIDCCAVIVVEIALLLKLITDLVLCKRKRSVGIQCKATICHQCKINIQFIWSVWSYTLGNNLTATLLRT